MSKVRNWTTIIISLAALACLVACGSDKSDKRADDDEDYVAPIPKGQGENSRPDPGTAKKPPDGQTTGESGGTATPPAAPKPETKPMGADKVTLYNYEYGKGKGAYKKVVKAMKGEQWAEVKAACEQALKKDPWHLQAHHSLAIALVQLGEVEAAVEHLDTALAGDWLRWGPWLDQNKNLSPLWSTDFGDKVKALAAVYNEEFMLRAKTGVWMLGQRTRYKRPTKVGKTWSSTRGEIFVYDVESKKFLRITHTRERVAGWVRSPSGDEIAWLGYWEVLMPDPAGAAGEAAAGEVAAGEVAAGDSPAPAGEAASEMAPVLFNRTIVGVLDGTTLVPVGKQAVLRSEVARVDIQYRIGDELIINGYTADSAWRDRAGEPSQRYTYDKEAGKLKKINAEPSDQPILSMTHEQIWSADKGPAEFTVNEAESGATLALDGLEQVIALPKNTSVVGVSRSADKAFALVRTVAEPCADPPTGSLYVVDTATGKLAHLLRGNSQFHVSWIDDRRFAYEDDNGRVRIHDLAEGKQVERLKNGGWLMLSGLSATRGIICQP